MNGFPDGLSPPTACIFCVIDKVFVLASEQRVTIPTTDDREDAATAAH